jgi:ribose transport system ATP-binding protein
MVAVPVTTREVPPGGPPALEVSGACKTFGRNRVLSDVDLRVAPGEIRALVGENGSGKSTLVKILAGYHAADAGTTAIRIAGRDITPHQPGESDDAGLRFVHQDLALVDALSTVENFGLGLGYGSRLGLPVRWAERRREARAAIERLGYAFDVDRPIATLQASERTAVAIARAVAEHRSPPRVLVLDEPTANMPGQEVERLFALVRRVRESGVAVLIITHHLNEVFDLADSVSILRDGHLVATTAPSEVTEDSLIELMVGRQVTRTQSQPKAARPKVVLAAAGLRGATLHGIDLEVGAGEIVGIAGITGSGREVVAPLLFGAATREGTVTIDGTVVKANRPDLSIAAGVGLIPAERARNAVIHGLDVGENLTVARLRDFVQNRTLQKRSESREVMSWIEKLDVRPRQPRLAFGQLSGGNAQKVILARWLRLEPKVMLLDEPTQGVDVGAKEDIHQRIEASAADGCAVLVCSTDNEELARVCTRVLVLVRGRVSSELHAPLELDRITAACLATGKD